MRHITAIFLLYTHCLTTLTKLYYIRKSAVNNITHDFFRVCFLILKVNNTDHYYESLNLSYQLPSSPPTGNNNNKILPLRKAPLPPTPTNSNSNFNSGTLSYYQKDLLGIPFILNSRMIKHDYSFEMPKCEKPTDTLEYDFNLERQVLCSTRSENRKSTSLNPFF